MSNEKSQDERKRKYRKKKRAQQEEATRQRIVDALVELHGTVGPAKTTVAEVARRAGVGRMTVYNHLPTELDMIGACSAHWAAQNPPPDPAGWVGIADADARLELALTELYAYYGQTRDMLGNVIRDEPLVPALHEIMRERWWPYVDAVVEVLQAGREREGAVPATVAAALRLAVQFETWQILTAAGLTGEQAARLAASMVRAA
jgi:AcrR family transcriptional regulator